MAQLKACHKTPNVRSENSRTENLASEKTSASIALLTEVGPSKVRNSVLGEIICECRFPPLQEFILIGGQIFRC